MGDDLLSPAGPQITDELLCLSGPLHWICKSAEGSCQRTLIHVLLHEARSHDGRCNGFDGLARPAKPIF